MRFTLRLQQEFRALFNFLLPPACALCLSPLSPPDPDNLCQACLEKFPSLKHPCCPICSLPYPANSGIDHRCQSCLQEKKISFSGVTALGPHEDLLREAVHRFKYRNDIDLDRPLGKMLARKIRSVGQHIDLVVPVPLHKNKFRQRGYNQSALIARQIARSLKLPIATDLLSRTESGIAQKEMAARHRAKNVRGVFSCTRTLHKERILLVDDVMTTGATARECAHTLTAHGAATVHVAILARAPLK